MSKFYRIGSRTLPRKERLTRETTKISVGETKYSGKIHSPQTSTKNYLQDKHLPAPVHTTTKTTSVKKVEICKVQKALGI